MRRAVVLLVTVAVLAPATPSDAALPRCSKPAAKVAKKTKKGTKRKAVQRKCRFAGWWPAGSPAALLKTPPAGSLPDATATPAPGGTTTPTTPGTTPATPAPEPLPRRLGVDEGEWYVRPSRRKVAAGSVEMNITNFGEDAHDLAVERDGTSYGKLDLEAGQARQLIADLPAGTYKLYCTLEDGEHEAAGMKATLTVE